MRWRVLHGGSRSGSPYGRILARIGNAGGGAGAIAMCHSWLLQCNKTMVAGADTE